MECAELNAALEVRELEQRSVMERWRWTNYYIASPYFDPKKITPTVEQFYPFPWDKNKKDRVRYLSYDERIEFATRRGKTDWIPDFWYQKSEKYQHLAKAKADKQTETSE